MVLRQKNFSLKIKKRQFAKIKSCQSFIKQPFRQNKVNRNDLDFITRNKLLFISFFSVFTKNKCCQTYQKF